MSQSQEYHGALAGCCALLRTIASKYLPLNLLPDAAVRFLKHTQACACHHHGTAALGPGAWPLDTCPGETRRQEHSVCSSGAP